MDKIRLGKTNMTVSRVGFGVTSHQIDVAKDAVKSGRFETIMFPFNFIVDHKVRRSRGSKSIFS